MVKTSPVPTLSYPANGATMLGVPYLQWQPLAYAASYDVQIDNDANFSSPVTTTTTKMTAWAYTEPLAAGTYYWRVRSNDADNRDGAWSLVRSFVLTPAAPTLVSPANGSYPAPATLLLQWSSSQPSPKYAVDISTSSDFTCALSGYPHTTVMRSWAPKTLLANGKYYWRVRALNASGATAATSGTFNFTIGSSVPVTAGATYHALTPTRLLDSRSGNGLAGAFQARVARTFTVTGRGGVPADAIGVTGNLTVTQRPRGATCTSGPIAGRTGHDSPSTSQGDTRANGVTVAARPEGKLSITYCRGSGQTAHASCSM